MSNLYSVAGCKIFIGGVKSFQPADFVESDFSSEVWTQIDGWTQMGAIGDQAQLITASFIGVGRDKKVKGTRNAGSMQNVFVVDDQDAGQIALIAAEQSNKNFAFRIDLNDATNGGQPSKRLFIALVTTVQEAGGEANTIRNLNATLEINSNFVRVAAT
jgi:hypothetical protein